MSLETWSIVPMIWGVIRPPCSTGLGESSCDFLFGMLWWTTFMSGFMSTKKFRSELYPSWGSPMAIFRKHDV